MRGAAPRHCLGRVVVSRRRLRGSRDTPLRVVDLFGAEGPTERKRTVRNENMGRISPFSAGKNQSRSASGLDRRFIACSHGVQRILIGIGGRLTAPPLPHHRAYGSRTTAVQLG